MSHHTTTLVTAATAIAALGALAYLLRRSHSASSARDDTCARCGAEPPVRLAVLHAKDGNKYNEAVMSMLRELLHSVGARIDLEELDLVKWRMVQLLPKLGSFDGFIIPGSPESVVKGAYAGQDPPDWIKPLELLLRQLSCLLLLVRLAGSGTIQPVAQHLRWLLNRLLAGV